MLTAMIRKNDKLARMMIGVVSFVVFAAVVFLSRVQLKVDLGFDVHVFARVYNEEKLVILSSFGDKAKRVKVKLSDEVVQAFQLNPDEDYIGHDMLRSSADVGMDKSRTFEVDILPYSSFIFKIK